MDTTDRSGIPTIYRSTRFRSRLEARWAAFFDLLRWPWVYEPFDAEGYIPDFLIQGKAPFLVEVGPCISHEDYFAKAVKPRQLSDDMSILVVGVTPSTQIATRGSSVPGGAIGKFLGPQDWGTEEAWAAAVLCGQCGQYAIFDTENLFTAFPCGHSDGGHAPGEFAAPIELEQLWRRAGNDVQWASNGPERIGNIVLRAGL